MEHFIRTAFWIVSLSSCLQTESLPISDFRINFMLKNVECPSESTFYAPTNVKKECFTTALDCILRELNGTAKVECKDPTDDINWALDALDRQITERSENGNTLTNSTECACERWPQTPFSEFLNETLSLLQKQNTEALPS